MQQYFTLEGSAKQPGPDYRVLTLLLMPSLVWCFDGVLNGVERVLSGGRRLAPSVLVCALRKLRFVARTCYIVP